MLQVKARTCDNRLLNWLPSGSTSCLLAHAERVPLTVRQVLYEPDRPVDAAYFIESGIVSILAVLESGSCAEVGVVGSEGMIGLPLLLGALRSPNEAMVLAPGHALRIEAADFQRELEINAPMKRLLMRYLQASYAQTSQTAACNGHHSIEERLAKWLLLACDRIAGNELDLTHEFLSMMLCVRRQGVSVAAHNLQKGGIIEYRRGRIRITDRDALEALACECYRASRNQFERIFQ